MSVHISLVIVLVENCAVNEIMVEGVAMVIGVLDVFSVKVQNFMVLWWCSDLVFVSEIVKTIVVDREQVTDQNHIVNIGKTVQVIYIVESIGLEKRYWSNIENLNWSSVLF